MFGWVFSCRGFVACWVVWWVWVVGCLWWILRCCCVWVLVDLVFDVVCLIMLAMGVLLNTVLRFVVWLRCWFCYSLVGVSC